MANLIHRHPRRARLAQQLTVDNELRLMAQEEAEILEELLEFEVGMEEYGDYDPDDPYEWEDTDYDDYDLHRIENALMMRVG